MASENAIGRYPHNGGVIDFIFILGRQSIGLLAVLRVICRVIIE
ncbi:MAG: hypothetical protein K0R57_1540 [Paenibacillaceae bacterium]|nr:hypothetical protein [Paenibacillaceae bacterium]